MASSTDYPAGCYLFVTSDSHTSVPLLVGDTRRIPDSTLTDSKMVLLLAKSKAAEKPTSAFKSYVVQLEKHKIVALMMGPIVGSYDSVVKEWLVDLEVPKASVQMTMYGLGYGLDYGRFGYK